MDSNIKGSNILKRICFVIAAYIVGSCIIAFQTYGMPELKKVFDSVDTSNPVADGEVGGKPTEDTFVVSTYEDLQIAMENDYLFTVEMSYIYYGGFTGSNYEWKVVKIDDFYFLALINMENKVEIDKLHDKSPVCRIVKEASEVQDKLVERIGEKAVTGYYLDMDGAAKSTYISKSDKRLIGIIYLLLGIGFLMIIPLMIVLTFWFLHLMDRVYEMIVEKKVILSTMLYCMAVVFIIYAFARMHMGRCEPVHFLIGGCLGIIAMGKEICDKIIISFWKN